MVGADKEGGSRGEDKATKEEEEGGGECEGRRSPGKDQSGVEEFDKKSLSRSKSLSHTRGGGGGEGNSPPSREPHQQGAASPRAQSQQDETSSGLHVSKCDHVVTG